MGPGALFKTTTEASVLAWALLEGCWFPAQPQLCLSRKIFDPDLTLQTDSMAWPCLLSCGLAAWSMDLILTYRLSSWLSLRPALSSTYCLTCTPGWTWPPSQHQSWLPCLDTVGLGPGKQSRYHAVGCTLVPFPEGAAMPLLLSDKKGMRWD